MRDEKDRHANENGLARQPPREDRLKRALRENLKRRKSQSRGRSELTAAVSNDDPPKDDATKT
jgi:hypothetical protein